MCTLCAATSTGDSARTASRSARPARSHAGPHEVEQLLGVLVAGVGPAAPVGALVRRDGQDLEGAAAVAGHAARVDDALVDHEQPRVVARRPRPRRSASICAAMPSGVPSPAATLATGPAAVAKARSPRSAACTAKHAEARAPLVARLDQVVRGVGAVEHVGEPREVGAGDDGPPRAHPRRRRRADAATPGRPRRRRSRPAPSRRRGRRARSMSRTSASGRAPEPPRGVDQPKARRPAVSDEGRKPVPGRRGSWMVAIAIQSTNERTTGCLNRSWTTSQALRARSARYRPAASESPRLRARSSTARGRRPAAGPLAHHRAEGAGVAAGPARDLVGGGVEVGVHHQAVAVGLRHHDRRVGVHVVQAVAGRAGRARRRASAGWTG